MANERDLEKGYWQSDQHALVGGMVMGIAMRHGFPMVPVMDSDGDYTNHYEIKDPEFDRNGIKVTVTIDPPKSMAGD